MFAFVRKKSTPVVMTIPHGLLSRVIPLLTTYGYAVLLPIAVIEGPAVAMIAGALVGVGQLNGLITYLLLVAADLVGDAAYFGLGRFGHAPLVAQFSRGLSLKAERLRPLEQWFRENDAKLLMIGKVQAFGSLILYFAGASRIPFLRFMSLNLIATLPKVALFELIGYIFGKSILHSIKYIDRISVTMFSIAILLLAIYSLITRRLWNSVARDNSR
jgi:membrane protein DedA with SNARE-associated domain